MTHLNLSDALLNYILEPTPTMRDRLESVRDRVAPLIGADLLAEAARRLSRAREANYFGAIPLRKWRSLWFSPFRECMREEHQQAYTSTGPGPETFDGAALASTAHCCDCVCRRAVRLWVTPDVLEVCRGVGF